MNVICRILDALRSLRMQPIPSHQKREFLREISVENVQRSFLIVGTVAFLELLVALFFTESGHCTKEPVYLVVLFNLVFLPLLWLLYRRRMLISSRTLQISVDFYVLGEMALMCAVAILPQEKLPTINTYVIALFVAATFIYMSPLERTLLFGLVYAGFVLALFHFQSNIEIVIIFSTNAFFMNVLAWILGQLILRMRLKVFLDRQTIEKNNAALQRLVTQDSMTALLNHEHAFLRLKEELSRAKRIGYFPLS